MRVGTDYQRSRTIELVPGAKRTSLKFDISTWAAIDLIAERNGIKWQEWARRVVAAHPDTYNKAGVIRSAVADELLAGIAAVAPANRDTPQIAHPMLSGFSVVGEAEFLPELRAARIVYSCDFGGFVFHAGNRAADYGGEPAIFIENKMRGELSVLLTNEASR